MSPANQRRDRRKHELRGPKCHVSRAVSVRIRCPRRPGQIMKYKKKKNLLTAGMTGSNEHDNFPFVRMNQSLDIPTG